MYVLGFVAVLAVVIFSASSRTSPPHVGNWDGQLYIKNNTDTLDASFQFRSDNRVVRRLTSSPGSTETLDGRCRIEYDEVPHHLHIDFSNGTVLNGLVRFSGRKKNTMFIRIGAEASPEEFSDTTSYYLLVKNTGEDVPPR